MVSYPKHFQLNDTSAIEHHSCATIYYKRVGVIGVLQNRGGSILEIRAVTVTSGRLYSQRKAKLCDLTDQSRKDDYLFVLHE